MRYRSTLAVVTFLSAHTSFAFDVNSINFAEQSLSYSFAHSQATPALLHSLDEKLPVVGGSLTSDIDTSTLPQYLKTSPQKDWDYLKEQTYTILGLSVTAVGLMTFLPESVTNWTAEDRDFSNLADKWWDNVSAGPIWDKDDHYLNYIMHPYFGGVYYTAARHSGFNEFESFIYSFAMSTFFWEYGVEAFAEIPSAQDIVVTPLFGAVVGEWMYMGEKSIVANGGDVLGSETLGNVSLFLLNPVGHIHHWVTGIWRDDASVSLSYDPWLNNKSAEQFARESDAVSKGQFLGLEVKLAF